MMCGMVELAEIETLLHNLIRVGQVVQADVPNAKVRVACGGNLTGWIPMPASVGRNFVAWTPMRFGESVTLACPSGDLAQARIISTGYTGDIPAPSKNADKDLVQFNDGTRIEYDTKTQTLDVYSAKNITLTAANHLNLAASHTFIKSPVTQTGGDMTSDGISAQFHTHPQNSGNHYGGGADTGKPK